MPAQTVETKACSNVVFAALCYVNGVISIVNIVKIVQDVKL